MHLREKGGEQHEVPCHHNLEKWEGLPPSVDQRLFTAHFRIKVESVIDRLFDLAA